MPDRDVPSSSPENLEMPDELVGRAAILLAKIGHVRCMVSYSVPVGMLVLLAAVLVSLNGPGATADFLPSTMMAAGFWVSGWGVQAISLLGLCQLLGASSSVLRVGLLGVESVPRVWSVSQATLISIGTVIPILLLGMLYRLIEGGFSMPQLAPADQAVWMPPSVGFKSHESIWLTGAWLCWVQAVLQMIPFPRTPGRQLIAALVVGLSRTLPEAVQVRLLRRLLVVFAFAIVAITLLIRVVAESMLAIQWPLLLFAGLLMFVSSRSEEVAFLIRGLHRGQESARQSSRPFLLQRFYQRILRQRDHRRLRRAMQRERGEAADAQRLDEILNQLHREGVESLNAEDRRILDRVSENLRRERAERESAS